DANARFVRHYNRVFAEPMTFAEAPNSTYDAFYFLAYASWAIDGAVTGPALARAFERLAPPGPEVPLGVGGIFDAFRAIRPGQSVDLQGATGPLDLDPKTGEARFDQDIVCAAVDDEGHATNVSSGLVYDGAHRSLRGALRCR